MNTNDPQAPYGEKPDECAPKEAIGPSGLTAKRIEELIIATGMNLSPLFSQREAVRRVIDGLVASGELVRAQPPKAYPTHDEIEAAFAEFYSTMNALGLEPSISHHPYEKQAAVQGELYTISHGYPGDAERLSFSVDSSDVVEHLKMVTGDWKPLLDKKP